MARELDKIINTRDVMTRVLCLYQGVIKSDVNEKISVHRKNPYHGYKNTLES